MLKVVSLFSGGGGMDCGLEAAGFETMFCTDIDHHSYTTLRHARFRASLGVPGGLKKAHILQRDVTQLDHNEILTLTGLKPGETDLLAGGPPCQSFSVFGRRQGLNDPRGLLVWHYLRILQGIQPKAFLFENVPGLLTIDDGKVFENFIEHVQQPFNGCRYRVQKYVLEAAKYGVPQFRTRVVIIGVLEGLDLKPPTVNPPRETHGLKSSLLSHPNVILPFNTARDALRGLPEIGASNAPRNHIGRVHGQPIIDRYNNLSFGERDSSTRINRLHPDRPSYTIVVGSDKGGGKGHVHPFEPREVTPRESARMQSFPDWWGFSGTSRHPIRQVGNAVPPILGAAIGSFVQKEIFGKEAVSREEMWMRLGQQHLLDAEAEKVQIEKQRLVLV